MMILWDKDCINFKIQKDNDWNIKPDMLSACGVTCKPFLSLLSSDLQFNTKKKKA